MEPRVAKLEAWIKAEVLRIEESTLFSNTVSTSLGNTVLASLLSSLSLVKLADLNIADLGME